jgi:hypothetical protein
VEQSWLDDLIVDAERVSDALVRLRNQPVPALRSSIATARKAHDDDTREAAYSGLQSALVPALGQLAPITLRDLQTSWKMHVGFQPTAEQRVGFWLLSVILLILVGYLTSLHDRAADVAQAMNAAQHSRMSEQAIKLYFIAREHKAEIVNASANGQQTIASETFFHELSDLQEAQANIASLMIDTQRVVDEIQTWNRGVYDVCRVTRTVLGVVRIPIQCSDPALQDLPPAFRSTVGGAGYSNVPPATLAQSIKAVGITLPASGQAPAGGAASDGLDGIYKMLDDADQFFQRVGLDQITTRLSSPLSALYIPVIKAALNVLQSWVIPAAYGSLGAAIFFTRLFLNPTLPNPDALRVIYRIMFGGFAGIVFAWFWRPIQGVGGGLPMASISAFGIAFLAGYGTDILFELLDRMVAGITAQIRKLPSPLDPRGGPEAGATAGGAPASGAQAQPAE